MSDLSNVLKALRIANKRIDELEKYNLDLANESHNKSSRIEQLKARIAELEHRAEEAEGKLSIVLDQHGHPDSYKCVVYDLTPLEAEKKLQDSIKRLGWLPPNEAAALRQERDELSATVERLREAGTKLRDDIDLSKIVGAGKRNFANEWDDVISATPAANLNHVKRAVFADGYYKGFSDAWDSNHDWQQDHINYGLERSEIVAEQEYPSVKDGES